MLNRLLDRPVSVSMIVLVFVVLGIIGIRNLPVSLIPDVDIPYVTVQVTAPDKSAGELDDAVVKPLRQSLVQIGRLKDIRSESKDGTATMTLTFEEGQDIDYFYIEVNEKIDRAMSSLPKMERPKVFKASATDIPAFYINVTMRGSGGDDFLGMSEFVEDVVSKRIEQLPQVAMVDISGNADREILVVPDEQALTRLGLTLQEFETFISSANVSLSNLTIRDGEYHYNVKFRSFAGSKEEIGNVYFKVGERLFQIKDVARVEERTAPMSGLYLSDGKDAVVMAVIKQSEARMADLKRSIDGQLEVFARDYPQLEFTLSRDQTELLQYSINNLLMNIVVALVLVCLVIFLFMKDFRSPLLVSLTIPLSLLVSFFIFYLIGLSINIISLAGLLLGVGMMVDNTIVLTDNITGRWQRGDDLRTAVVKGTGEVAGAMLSSVLTTCAVFIPLVFLNGLAGELFYDQAISLSVVLLVSWLVTVTVIPVYYWALYRRLPAFRPNQFLSKIQLRGGMRIYDAGVNWFLSHKYLVCWTLPLFCIVIAAVCLAYMPRQKIPDITYTDAILNLDWNEHISVEQNRSRVLELENTVLGECEQTSAMVGVQQFVLSHSGDQSMSEASVYFKCRDASSLERVKARVSEYLRGRYPAALSSFSASGNIFDLVFSEREAQLLVRLRPTGDDGLQVVNLQEMLSELKAALPGIGIPPVPLKEDVLYISDPERMRLYGVSFSDLVEVLRNSLNGNTVFEIIRGNRSVPVVLGTDVQGMKDVLSATVTTKEGAEIPLEALMRQTYEQTFKTLISGDEGNYYPLELDMPSSRVRPAMESIGAVVRSDPRFDVSFGGAYFSNREMMRQMAMVMFVALALLFLILASQFESLVQPLIILSEIVIDVAFSLLFLWAAGVSINIMSLIGLVVITGIVINDSILKVDTINRLVRGGMEVDAAVHEAGHRRIKAIIMTSITTVFSVVPFLSRGNMGSDLQYPMAIVIVVGMTVGTVISLFFLPALYSAVYNHKKR